MAAGCELVVAYTADRQTQTMISELAAVQMQPVVLEMREGLRKHSEQLADSGRGLHETWLVLQDHTQRVPDLDGEIGALTEIVPGHGEKLAEHNRKHDILLVRMDSVQMQMALGGLGVLVTVLMAVFGFLVAA